MLKNFNGDKSKVNKVTDLPIVLLEGVSKSFKIRIEKSLKGLFTSKRKAKGPNTFHALKDVSFRVQPGETLGLMGHNGSGKSTLLKVIGGIVSSDTGQVYRRGRVAALLELGTGFHPDLSGRQNVYLNAAILGLSTKETDEVFQDILDFSGISEFIDTQVKFYSSGMYVRLAFAIAVHSDPDLLLVDEVLAVGDEPFQQKCIEKIKQFQRDGRTIVFVSHSAEQVSSICSRGIVLEHGEIIFDGVVEDAVRALHLGYENATAAEREAKYLNQLKESGFEENPFAIKKVVISDDSGILDSNRAIVPGVTLYISIEVIVRKAIDWVLGFTISRADGAEIYRLNTEGFGIEPEQKPGNYTVKFTIEDTNFAGGKIQLTAGSTTRLGAPLDSFPHAITLVTSGDPVGGGSVQFPANCEVSTN